jgi:hypothetical protein
LTEARQRVATQLARLPDELRGLDTAGSYEVRIASALQRLAEAVNHYA